MADRPAITLPDAVRECVLNNMRLKAAAERVSMAQADYITESLIPNPQLLVDAQLLPVSIINFDNQAGPPQYDALVTLPVDWFVFGKRVAAQAAARLNVDAAQAEFADQLRRQIALTVDSFYDALEADLALKLAEQDLDALRTLETVAAERAKADNKSTLEQRRVRLAILDTQREIRKRRAAAETTKSKLQANVGRPPDTPDFVVRGTLAVRATAPALTPNEAWALAERFRPDLIAAQRGVAAAESSVERERRRGLPQVAVTSGVDFQDQKRITGFRNASLWTVAVNTSLPFTDRNQGRVLGAQASVRMAAATLGALTADARAEVEQAVAEYTEAVNGVTGEDVTSLRTAREVRAETLAAYRAGDKDLVDALDAERAYRDRLRNTLANLADYWQALNHVNAAVGRRVLTAAEADRDSLLDDARPKDAAPPK
ncbi:TolC family protein [Limnoglobus roseus]|uniref:TolC family protein n=1 Tax=Limnoglobus roseus TaxID=2598579 RepID=UPI00143D685E|nr:TolC family protein [Limnoglobus roseus]